MEIGVPYRALGAVEIGPLLAAVTAQDEAAWTEQDLRQRRYDVHHHTESIILLFCTEDWPNPVISRHPGWDRLADTAVPLMEGIIARAYPPRGTILRAMAARLLPGGRIRPHVDALPSFAAAHRIHVPLTAGPGVRFTVDGRPCPMRIGEAYEINNQTMHSVMNRDATPRISFIFDYLP